MIPVKARIEKLGPAGRPSILAPNDWSIACSVAVSLNYTVAAAAAAAAAGLVRSRRVCARAGSANHSTPACVFCMACSWQFGRHPYFSVWYCAPERPKPGHTCLYVYSNAHTYTHISSHFRCWWWSVVGRVCVRKANMHAQPENVILHVNCVRCGFVCVFLCVRVCVRLNTIKTAQFRIDHTLAHKKRMSSAVIGRVKWLSIWTRVTNY